MRPSVKIKRLAFILASRKLHEDLEKTLQSISFNLHYVVLSEILYFGMLCIQFCIFFFQYLILAS
jgi:hypothetical protein